MVAVGVAERQRKPRAREHRAHLIQQGRWRLCAGGSEGGGRAAGEYVLPRRVDVAQLQRPAALVLPRKPFFRRPRQRRQDLLRENEAGRRAGCHELAALHVRPRKVAIHLAHGGRVNALKVGKAHSHHWQQAVRCGVNLSRNAPAL